MTAIGIGIGVGMSSSMGGGFRPSQLSGLAVWLLADASNVTLDGSNNVSQWNDTSGNGRHLVQATTTKRPPYSASGGPNGTPYVGTFDNVDDFLRVTYVQAQPEDVFAFVMPSASSAGNGTILDGATGNTRRLYTPAAGQAGIFAGGAVNGVWTESAWHRVRGEFNGASSGITVDDTARVAGNAGTASSGGIIIGLFGDQTSDPGDCRIAEIIIYSRILSAAEAAQVQAYLQLRYGQ